MLANGTPAVSGRLSASIHCCNPARADLDRMRTPARVLKCARVSLHAALSLAADWHGESRELEPSEELQQVAPRHERPRQDSLQPGTVALALAFVEAHLVALDVSVDAEGFKSHCRRLLFARLRRPPEELQYLASGLEVELRATHVLAVAHQRVACHIVEFIIDACRQRVVDVRTQEMQALALIHSETGAPLRLPRQHGGVTGGILGVELVEPVA